MHCSNFIAVSLGSCRRGAFLVVVPFALAVLANSAKGEPPKIDGLFDDWKEFHTGWEETGGVGVGPSGFDVDLKQFYYSNDEKWLYLFFKSQPSLEERYRKNKYSGMVGELYFDTDRSSATGGTILRDVGSPAIRSGAIRGIDVSCWVPIGVGFRSFPDGRSERFYGVSYHLRVWDARQQKFAIERTISESGERHSLIAHGKDGFELAIPLADLQIRSGDTFDFICVEWADNGAKDANRVTITLD